MSPRASAVAVVVAFVAAVCLAVSAARATPAAVPGAGGAIAYVTFLPQSLLDLFASHATGLPRDSEICLVDPATGRTQRLVDGYDDVDQPAWSPDGSRLVVVEHGMFDSGGLRLMGLDGSIIKRLFSGTFLSVSAPAFTPDGRSLTFDAVGAADLVTGGLETGATETMAIPAGHVDWSPDGTLAVGDDGTGISVWRSDGTRVATFGPPSATSPSFSPDGTRVAYAVPGGGDSGLEKWTIDVATVDGSEIQPVIDVVAPDDPSLKPVWSPDGTSLAYTAYSSDPFDRPFGAAYPYAEHHVDLFVIRVGPTGAIGAPSDLTPGPLGAIEPAWGVASSALPAFDRPCSVSGTSGNDSIAGTRFDDRIFGLGGDDTVEGGGARDAIWGGLGNDHLHGGAGNDGIDGGWGNDTITGDAGNDVLDGGSGNDVIRARDGARDTISCGYGRDTVEADQFDRVAKDCERVLRKRVQSGP